MPREIPLHLQLKQILSELETQKAKGTPLPHLLLHSCCAPCSTSVIEKLARYFKLTVFYYNPNIDERGEYETRLAEQKAFVRRFNAEPSTESINEIECLEGEWDVEEFLNLSQGHEHDREGGERCSRCFLLRLEATAKKAASIKADYFCTTLTVSPLKNAAKINETGQDLAKRYGIAWLPSDFKKENGYKRSVEISKEMGMYRQDWCGCSFSKKERTRAP